MCIDQCCVVAGIAIQYVVIGKKLGCSIGSWCNHASQTFHGLGWIWNMYTSLSMDNLPWCRSNRMEITANMQNVPIDCKSDLHSALLHNIQVFNYTQDVNWCVLWDTSLHYCREHVSQRHGREKKFTLQGTAVYTDRRQDMQRQHMYSCIHSVQDFFAVSCKFLFCLFRPSFMHAQNTLKWTCTWTKKGFMGNDEMQNVKVAHLEKGPFVKN